MQHQIRPQATVPRNDSQQRSPLQLELGSQGRCYLLHDLSHPATTLWRHPRGWVFTALNSRYPRVSSHSPRWRAQGTTKSDAVGELRRKHKTGFQIVTIWIFDRLNTKSRYMGFKEDFVRSLLNPSAGVQTITHRRCEWLYTKFQSNRPKKFFCDDLKD